MFGRCRLGGISGLFHWEPEQAKARQMFMTTTEISIESIQSQIAHAVGTENTRTRQEHLELLADLLADAFQAVSAGRA